MTASTRTIVCGAIDLASKIVLTDNISVWNSNSYTLKRLRNSSSTTVSPRLPMKRVLQGGLSFVFCKRKLEYLKRNYTLPQMNTMNQLSL